MTKRIGTIGGFALHEEEDFGGVYLYGIAYLHFDTMAWAFFASGSVYRYSMDGNKPSEANQAD